MIRFSISKHLFGLFSFPLLFLKLPAGRGEESEIKFLTLREEENETS